MWFGLKGWDILAVVLLCERTVLTGLYLHNPKESYYFPYTYLHTAVGRSWLWKWTTESTKLNHVVRVKVSNDMEDKIVNISAGQCKQEVYSQTRDQLFSQYTYHVVYVWEEEYTHQKWKENTTWTKTALLRTKKLKK